MDGFDVATFLEEIKVYQDVARKRFKPPSAKAYIPHDPTDKQRTFLDAPEFEVLYGGAAGGGKTDALLMAALQYVHIPGYAALLLRRTYTDLSLPGAIMDRAHHWLANTDARWNGIDRKWLFPSGAVLAFGYLDNERDRFRYQGAELQFIGFDELTQFPERWYLYLLSRLRRLQSSGIPLRARAASNPGGVGHDWVFRRFVRSDEGERCFVPATCDDNPHLDGAAYRATLQKLDPITRTQLLEGKWIRDSSGLVYHSFDEERCCIEEAPACTSYLLGIDLGYVDDCAFSVVGYRPHDSTTYVLESFKQDKLVPSEAARIVKELEQKYKFERIVADIGGLGKGYVEEARQRFLLPIEAAEKTNKRGYIDLLNGAFHNGEVKLVRRLNDALVDELKELPWTEDRKKEADGFANHLCDALLYSWRACTSYRAEEAPEPLAKMGTTAYYALEAKRMEEKAIEQYHAQLREEKDMFGYDE